MTKNNAQVATRKKLLMYQENQTTNYQTFMKIIMDLDDIDLGTISFLSHLVFLFYFSLLIFSYNITNKDMLISYYKFCPQKLLMICKYANLT
jgi:hypothetical protein